MSPLVHGGCPVTPRDVPLFEYGCGTFAQGHGGYPPYGGQPSAQVSPSVHGGHLVPSWDAPLFEYGGGGFPQGYGGYPRVATLVALSLGYVGLLPHPLLPQEDHHSSSGSGISISFSSPGQGLPPPVLYHPYASGVIPPSAPSDPAISLSSSTKVLKLDSIKDTKAYLDALGIIKFYLRDPAFSLVFLDSALITTSSNFEASRFWEGQLHLAVKDRELCFLFKKGKLQNTHT